MALTRRLRMRGLLGAQAVVLGLVLGGGSGHGEEFTDDLDEVPKEVLEEVPEKVPEEQTFSPHPFVAREFPRIFNEALLPVASFFLPGLGQWVYGEWDAGLALSGAAYVGYSYHKRWAYSVYGVRDLRDDFPTNIEGVPANHRTWKNLSVLESKNDLYRRISLGRLVQQGAGGLSLYGSFRTAVLAAQPDGPYQFMGQPDSVVNILAAPFNFSYLKRPTTWVPLLIGLGLNLGSLVAYQPEDSTWDPFTLKDGFYTSAFSFNAGTHEEAVFRGWVMPVFRQVTGEDWAANLIQSLAFGLAHQNQISLPLFQTLMGAYLGHLTIGSDYRFGESVFIHTWWDVMSIGALYAFKPKSVQKSQRILPPLVITPLSLAF